MREVRYSRCCNKSSSVEVPSVGDSGLEILHDGEGGDVELGARTSEHILVFAFDPLSLNSLTLLFVQSIIASFIAFIHIACVVPYIISYCLSSIICLACLCVPHLYLSTRTSYSTSTHI